MALQVFKICLDYWNFFVPDVYASVTTGLADGNAPFAFVGMPAATGAVTGGRKALYREVLSRLRLLMITRMAKPEEVRTVHADTLSCDVYAGWCCCWTCQTRWPVYRTLKCNCVSCLICCESK